MKRIRALVLAVVVGGMVPVVGAEVAVYDEAPIHYSTTRPVDPVTRLQEKMKAGEVELGVDDGAVGVLPAVLKELGVPVSSQVLVFSRTSLQRSRISPGNPRALYFNDDTYVGYVPGGRVVEVATTDPHLGSVFYTINLHPGGGPKLVRQVDNCLECHAGAMTRGMPGLVVRSVFPDEGGEPILSAGTFVTTQESPIGERWGGWYVTGQIEGAKMANRVYEEGDSGATGGTVLELGKEVDKGKYLTPYSDPVALMVLEHQVEGHNRLSRALYATERAIYDADVMAKALGEKPGEGGYSESTMSRIKHACDPLVEYMLFSNEAPLSGEVKGVSGFREEFEKRGPRDGKGRSLRDFDLKTRMFKYPCSYLIYTESFDALPGPALAYVYQRLYDVLTGKDQSKAFAHLSAEDRQAILEILRGTKKGLPPYWEGTAGQ